MCQIALFGKIVNLVLAFYFGSCWTLTFNLQRYLFCASFEIFFMRRNCSVRFIRFIHINCCSLFKFSQLVHFSLRQPAMLLAIMWLLCVLAWTFGYDSCKWKENSPHRFPRNNCPFTPVPDGR